MKTVTGLFNREAVSQTEKAFVVLEELIVTGELPPGSQWSEIALSERIGLGRSPTRAALQKLAFQHLVNIAPREGIFISEIDYPGQIKVIQARREIEKLIMAEAARSATEQEREDMRNVIKQLEALKADPNPRGYLRTNFDWTKLLCEACRNSYAAEFYAMLAGLARRFWFFHQEHYTNLPVICELHIRQLQAVVDGAVNEAIEAAAARNDYAENFARTTLMDMINLSAVTVRVSSQRRLS
ncbi:GntR family transcriptional regulator [Noviherbaspirillum sp. L7-7A]|uniref:GntR family transcriptional regulator n=1 Tax=Noviherbaspirillum sp. L7-7A TaxID=2850560 RepID=UPI001C2BCE39|nr:GntR family transcriptional regulator [Noviherbaspirillum sp. L7-7A]MBV0881519.1 GntR family transcriptional regulator [Noviherbaspirillum sp. L7-7A]